MSVMSSRSKAFLAGCLVVCALTGVASAQKVENYQNGRSQFPNLIGPYMPAHPPEPSFSNSPRIDRLMREGKIYLSIDDAIAMALENNLDLAIARYNLTIADTDILRAKAGAAIRGVSTGLVQGTPGGGVGTTTAGGVGTGGTTGATGGGAGGTTTGAGGAGTGALGIVSSTLGVGANVPQFDPILTGTLSIEHAITPLSNTVFTGTNNLRQNTGTANFNWFQGFATGTSLNVNFQNTRVTSNALFNALNPVLNSSFRMTLSQHLLAGLGWDINRRFIIFAKNNRRISDSSFRQQVMTTVSQIENIYWDLVSAYEDVKVKERSLALSQKTLADNKKQVEIGTLAPIEIVRAESQVASDSQALIVSQTNLQLQQLLMKNAITKTESDPAVASAPVIPTDAMSVPENEPVTPLQDLLKLALASRPEIEQSQIDLVNRKLNKKAAANGLLPTVDLFAFYGAAGLGGVQNPLNPDIPPGTIPTTTYGDTFGNLFDSSAPDKGVGILLQIPIRNRSAQADQIRATLEYQQAETRLQQLENQIGIEVRNAQFTVEQNAALVKAAQSARELAAQSLDAEQKKYALGASTTTLVLQAQRDLTQAESNLVTALSSYEKSRVELDRVTGQTLNKLNIQIPDAVSGTVSKEPVVPGVIKMEQTPGAPPTPSQTQPQQQTPPQNPPQASNAEPGSN